LRSWQYTPQERKKRYIYKKEKDIYKYMYTFVYIGRNKKYSKVKIGSGALN
jgi:hypothetical protein